MTAVIRVKRRLDEDPLEALVLSFKKRRTEDEEEVAELTVLRFTGTVDHKNDDETIPKALRSFKTSDLTKLGRKWEMHSVRKRREASRKQSKDNRFKILSCNRKIMPGEEGSNFTIVDVDNDLMEESNGAEVSTQPKYVYDLYSADFLGDDGDFIDGYYEGLVSVQPFSTELEYRGSEDSEEIDPYDEDSNDEGNWRNDYPDSDHSINEDDMRLAASLRGMGLDNGYDLSSDDESESMSCDLYKMLEKHRKNNSRCKDVVSDEDEDEDECT